MRWLDSITDLIDISSVQFSSVQFSHLRLFATPWTAASQTSLSITNSQSLLKFMSTELAMPSSHLILCHPLSPLAFNLSQHQGLFQWVSSSHQVAKVLEFQHRSFQLVSSSQGVLGCSSASVQWVTRSPPKEGSVRKAGAGPRVTVTAERWKFACQHARHPDCHWIAQRSASCFRWPVYCTFGFSFFCCCLLLRKILIFLFFFSP